MAKLDVVDLTDGLTVEQKIRAIAMLAAAEVSKTGYDALYEAKKFEYYIRTGQ